MIDIKVKSEGFHKILCIILTLRLYHISYKPGIWQCFLSIVSENGLFLHIDLAIDDVESLWQGG